MARLSVEGPSLTVIGTLDEESENQYRSALAKLEGTSERLVHIDLTQVNHISSLCVGALVALWIDLYASGRRLEVLPSSEVKRVFDVAGISHVFEASRQGSSSESTAPAADA